MRGRRRVSLGESFTLAGKAALGADDPTHGDASFVATILFGLWWWVVGVPEKRDKP